MVHSFQLSIDTATVSLLLFYQNGRAFEARFFVPKDAAGAIELCTRIQIDDSLSSDFYTIIFLL